MERLAGQIMLSCGFRRALIAFLAGAVAIFAQPPFDFVAAPFVSFTVLVWLLDGASPDSGAGFLRRHLSAFGIGWWFGFGYFIAGLWWLANAFVTEGGYYVWAIPLAVTALPAFLAIFYGLATVAARFLWSDGLGRIFALAFGFGLGEWLRGFLFTGFPWNAIGYGAMPVPLMMQSSRPLGIFAVGALAVFVYATPALYGTRRGRVAGTAVAVLLVAAHLGYGAWVLAVRAPQIASAADAPVVRLVQPSVPLSGDWGAEQSREAFERHLQLTELPADEGKQPSIIIWPETAIPYILTVNPEPLSRIAAALKPGQVLLAGAVRAEDQGQGPTRYYNSMYAIDDNGVIVAAADKAHLVPFGEYLPFEEFFRNLGIVAIASAAQGYSQASRTTLLSLPGGLTVLPLICYEAIFPAEVLAAQGNADVMINITNDAWYGDTPGPYQHLRQAQLRTVETGLPMIRVANSGISVVVDAIGRITDGMRFDEIGALDATLPGKYPAIIDRNSQFMYFWIVMAALLLLSQTSLIGLDRNRN